MFISTISLESEIADSLEVACSFEQFPWIQDIAEDAAQLKEIELLLQAAARRKLCTAIDIRVDVSAVQSETRLQGDIENTDFGVHTAVNRFPNAANVIEGNFPRASSRSYRNLHLRRRHGKC